MKNNKTFIIKSIKQGQEGKFVEFEYIGETKNDNENETEYKDNIQ